MVRETEGAADCGDISLNVTTGSSLGTTTLPDTLPGSTTSSLYLSSPEVQPPVLPQLRSSAQLRKLRSLESGRLQLLEETGCQPLLPSGKTGGKERRSCHTSSGVWTASEGEREEEERAEHEPEVRPHSSLSTGVISDCSTSQGEAAKEGEATLREGDTTLEEGSIHSCDTEGYYTTFHDFDGFQEALAEADLVVNEEEVERRERVVLRRKSARKPAPPQRLSSLMARDSTGTVVERGELQGEERKEMGDESGERVEREGSAVSTDLSFDSEERRERLETKTAMSPRHIPSMCLVTPPDSGGSTPQGSR